VSLVKPKIIDSSSLEWSAVWSLLKFCEHQSPLSNLKSMEFSDVGRNLLIAEIFA
jgi:hypothetical protein